jgi:hypothetical protein
MMPAQHHHARGPIRGTSRFNAAGSSSELVIPFDHAASFELRGIPGNIVQDVINISNDGSFVAVAIGYGFEEDRARAAKLEPHAAPPPPPPPPPPPVIDFLPGEVELRKVPVDALIEGFRLNPDFERVILAEPPLVGGRRGVSRERTFTNVRIPKTFDTNIIQRLKTPEEVSFLFSMVDTATGRELQDEPIHNIASLGISNGERPFRMLAQPLTFRPQSTVRLQIVERSEGLLGTLFIVLYGYKVVTGCVEGARLPLPDTLANQPGRVIPFDYVTTFQLSGSPGNQIEDEIPINVEGGFVATSIGYGLAVDSLGVTLSDLPEAALPDDPPPDVNLSIIRFNQFPTSALQGGIRIRPNFLRVAFDNAGNLNTVSHDVANRVFERLNRPDDVSFRYSIFESGTGRELQNQPINNIAGLGIANGERPFKKLARPMLFQPRSTIRVTVEEHFGRGTLFIVFQGYKLLSASPNGLAPTPIRRQRRR